MIIENTHISTEERFKKEVDCKIHELSQWKRKFAFFPFRVSNTERIWLQHYQIRQIYVSLEKTLPRSYLTAMLIGEVFDAMIYRRTECKFTIDGIEYVRDWTSFQRNR